MSNAAEILIIDDEVQIRRLLEITLQANGYRTLEADTARGGLIAAANHPPDIILLDIGLPDGSGHDVLEKLREWYSNPVIMLSVQNSEEAIVKALDKGADDYLVKPFRTGELLARIRTALRKRNSTEASAIGVFGDLQIDFAARLVRKGTEVLKLTATEYNLLTLLARNEGKVLTHTYLLTQVWGPTYSNETQYLRVFVAQLRKKIEDNINQPRHLLTESGVGYRFVTG